MAVDPTGEQIQQFRDGDDGAPVVMLNLLRFRPDGGRERYQQYARAVGQRFLPAVGGEVIFHGQAAAAPLIADASGDWDEVLLVRYPSRQAFLQMLADPAYQEVTALRTEALEDAVLQPLATGG